MTKTHIQKVLLLVAVCAFGAPHSANALVQFRNPLNLSVSPAINYYFDNNRSAAGWQTYWGATSGGIGAASYNPHEGTDFKTVTSSGSTWPVFAAAQGTPFSSVTDCATTGSPGCGGGFGNHVRIDHEGVGTDSVGMVSIYAHLTKDTGMASTSVPIGCGTQIGLTGASGSVEGAHLHFELRALGTKASVIDPFAGSHSHPESYWYATTTGSGAQSGGVPTTQCQPVPLWPTNLSVDVAGATSLRLNYPR